MVGQVWDKGMYGWTSMRKMYMIGQVWEACMVGQIWDKDVYGWTSMR